MQVSNEELALRIKRGEQELLPQLWSQVYKFAASKALSFVESAKQSGVNASWDVDDLKQEAFFALLQAIGAYEVDIGANFLTIFRHQLTWHFSQTFGHKAKATVYNDAFICSVSGDAPLSDDSHETILTLYPDPSEACELAVREVYLQQLHEALERSLSKLTRRQEEIIRSRYYKQLPKNEIAEDLAITSSTVSSIEKAGLSRMYATRCESGLDQFVEERTNPFHSVGIASYKRTRTSAVELVAMRRERLAHEWFRMRKAEERR